MLEVLKVSIARCDEIVLNEISQLQCILIKIEEKKLSNSFEMHSLKVIDYLYNKMKITYRHC